MKNGTFNNSKKKSLCILVECFVVGGVERVIIDALNEISDFFDVTLFVYSNIVDKNVLKKLPDNVRVVVGSRSMSRIRALLLSIPVLGELIIRRALREKFDYLVVAKPHFLMASRSGMAVETVYWDHSGKDAMYADSRNLSFLRKINKIRIAYGIRKYDSVWLLSNEIKEQIDTAFSLKNSVVLSNPMDCEAVLAKSQETPEDLEIRSDFNIVMVGRLSPEKGFARVVSALSELDSIKDWHLFIIGDGQERENLLNLREGSKVKDRITLLGAKDNPYKYMKCMQLLVCPSYAESFGLVMLEAALLKVPVLATDTQGARYVLGNGKYGIIMPNDDGGIKEALEKILNESGGVDVDVESVYLWAMKHDKKVFGKNMLKCLDEDGMGGA